MSLMSIKMSLNKKFPILALSGGVGGVKLIQGFTKILSPDQLITIVNTGDDEEFLGLRICPDIDTTIYTLSGQSNKKTGWGLEKESWKILKSLEKMGINQWFKIGDNDLVTHLIRTHFLKSGKTLTETTNKIRKLYGLKFKILPMSDEWFKTKLITKNKKMSFQEYFVKEKSKPVINSIIWENDNQKNISSPSDQFKKSLKLASSIVFCPSNPLLSIAPIIKLKGIKKKIQNFEGNKIMISPIRSGHAFKGPTIKIMNELNYDPSPLGLIKFYKGLCNIFILDPEDYKYKDDIIKEGIKPIFEPLELTTLDDKIRMAKKIISIIN